MTLNKQLATQSNNNVTVINMIKSRLFDSFVNQYWVEKISFMEWKIGSFEWNVYRANKNHLFFDFLLEIQFMNFYFFPSSVIFFSQIGVKSTENWKKHQLYNLKIERHTIENLIDDDIDLWNMNTEKNQITL